MIQRTGCETKEREKVRDDVALVLKDEAMNARGGRFLRCGLI
jgi:hypothetical protein